MHHTEELPTVLTKEAQFDEVLEGASDAAFGMHHREFVNASDICTRYLGRDVLAEQRAEEFSALPQQEQNEMARKRDFGEYGAYHLVSLPEVSLALRLVAHEILPGKASLQDHDLEKLSRPEMVETISTRFPDMTPQRISAILAL